MRLKLLFPIFIAFLLIGCSAQKDVEDELYSNLKTEFKKKDVDLRTELYKVESLLVKRKILDDKSWKSREAYFKFAAKHDSFPQLANHSELLAVLKSPLNFQALSIVTDEYSKHNDEDFLGSKFNALLKQLETNPIEDRKKPSVIAESVLLKLDSTDFKKPFYRTLTLMLIVSTMDEDNSTRDYIIKNEEDFYIAFGYTSYACVPGRESIEERNILRIATNNLQKILVIGEPLKVLDSLSVKLIEFYAINRNLGQKGTEQEICNPSSASYNYPFYSYISYEEIVEQTRNAEEAYNVSVQENVPSDIVDFRVSQLKNWYAKKKVMELYVKEELPEIHPQAVIYVDFMPKTSDAFKEKVYQEIFEAINELRNDESQELFGESYEEIKARQNIFKNDFQKLRLLEILFPMRITENPDNFYLLNEPVEVLLEP